MYLGIVLLVAFVSTETYAQKEWERLGVRKVNYGLDRDVIKVGLKDGRFTKLRFVVRGGGLNMHRVVVQYGNGSKDELEVRHNFKKGSLTRVVDLKGNKRVIRDITFWYDTKNISSRRATLTVFGRR